MGLFSTLRKEPETDPIWDWLAGHPDALGALVSLRRNPDWRYRMQVGYSDGSWRQTDQRTHMLVLGPSQGSAGKTSGMLTPGILAHFGPCLATTSKFDLAQATAMARARLGDVWWYDP